MSSKQKAKRKVISTALHAELSEYTALLRALKTRDLLDLSAQLQDHGLARRREEEEEEVSNTGVSSSSARPHIRPLKYKREIWTRWPLNPKDIYVPLWDMADEVAVVARWVLKRRDEHQGQRGEEDEDQQHESHQDVEAEDAEQQDDELRVIPGQRQDSAINQDLDDDDDDPDLPPYTYHLTELLHSFLDHVFATLALHTPSRPKSMLNRIAPLNWEFVLNTLAGELTVPPAGLATFAPSGRYSRQPKTRVTEKMIQNASHRLQSIYGPPGDNGYLVRRPLEGSVSQPQPRSQSKTKATEPEAYSVLAAYRSNAALHSTRLFANAVDEFWTPPKQWLGTADEIEKLERRARRKQGRKLPEDDDESNYKPPRKVVKKSKRHVARGNSSPKKKFAASGDETPKRKKLGRP